MAARGLEETARPLWRWPDNYRFVGITSDRYRAQVAILRLRGKIAFVCRPGGLLSQLLLLRPAAGPLLAAARLLRLQPVLTVLSSAVGWLAAKTRWPKIAVAFTRRLITKRPLVCLSITRHSRANLLRERHSICPLPGSRKLPASTGALSRRVAAPGNGSVPSSVSRGVANEYLARGTTAYVGSHPPRSRGRRI